MTEAIRRPGPADALRTYQAVARAGGAPPAEPGHGGPRAISGDAWRVAERRPEVESEMAGPEAQGPGAAPEGPPDASLGAAREAGSETAAGEGPGASVGASVGAPVAAPAVTGRARAAGPEAPGPDIDPGPEVEAAWAALPALALDPRHLRRHRVVTAQRSDPAHGAFDVLRTRVLGEMERRGWRRLGITSPTKGCGKTFTAVNLAVTLSRLTTVRTLLLDLDLRRPSVASLLGATRPGPLGDVLRGLVPPARALLRVGSSELQLGRLALGLNGRPEPFAAELFRDARAAAALAEAEAALRPSLTIFDLPPALAQDDVLALRPHYDALLLVAGGGQTTPRELKEAARRLGPDVPILGVVLNKAEGEEVEDYAYDYG